MYNVRWPVLSGGKLRAAAQLSQPVDAGGDPRDPCGSYRRFWASRDITSCNGVLHSAR